MIDDLDTDNKEKVKKMIIQIKEVSQTLSPMIGEAKIRKNITGSLEKMVRKKVITREECDEIILELGYTSQV